MTNNSFIPPLRLIVNSICNGKCEFCHKEGNITDNCMPETMIFECIQAAEKVSVSHVAFTGGEPTLRNDLHEIINKVQRQFGRTNISLTTNGCKLKELGEKIEKPIYSVNLSMTSLDENIAAKYQNVNPQKALRALEGYPAIHKNLNIVLSEDNYKEIDAFIAYCKEKGISMDLMIQAIKNTEYFEIQKEVINKLILYGDSNIILKSTPSLRINVCEKCVINVKHPYLNELFHSNLCDDCGERKECFEKVCAVRVHPNGLVTPCLSVNNNVNSENVIDDIIRVYANLGKMTFLKKEYENR